MHRIISFFVLQLDALIGQRFAELARDQFLVQGGSKISKICTFNHLSKRYLSDIPIQGHLMDGIALNRPIIMKYCLKP